MKIVYLLISLLLSSVVSANSSITGVWVDKTNPDKGRFEFKAGNDFVYTIVSTYQGKTNEHVAKGAWEAGSWAIKFKDSAEKICNLSIYAESKECCFSTKPSEKDSNPARLKNKKRIGVFYVFL